MWTSDAKDTVFLISSHFSPSPLVAPKKQKLTLIYQNEINTKD